MQQRDRSDTPRLEETRGGGTGEREDVRKRRTEGDSGESKTDRQTETGKGSVQGRERKDKQMTRQTASG